MRSAAAGLGLEEGGPGGRARCQVGDAGGRVGAARSLSTGEEAVGGVVARRDCPDGPWDEGGPGAGRPSCRKQPGISQDSAVQISAICNGDTRVLKFQKKAAWQVCTWRVQYRQG